MQSLPDDIQWHIYKLYFSKHVLSLIPIESEKMESKYYFKNNVQYELLNHSTGDYISKLINEFMKDNPKNPYVRENNVVYWDHIYYMLLSAHLRKICDLFLFTTLKDAIKSLHT